MLDTAWIALIGTVFGGAGLKVIEKVLSKGMVKDDIATNLRTELRKDATELRAELKVVEHELDNWKVKYFELLQQFIELKSEHPPTPPPSPPPVQGG